MMEGRYSRYQSANPRIPCEFLYPAGWRVREVVEDGNVAIHIVGPRNRAGTYSVSLGVGVTQAGNRTASQAATEWLARHRSTFSIQESGPRTTTVAGMPAQEVEVVHWIPLPVNSARPQRTVIRERWIFFARGDALYKLRYAAPEEDFETWLEALDVLVESFALPHEVVESGPQPSVVPSGREESPAYEVEEHRDDGEAEQRRN